MKQIEELQQQKHLLPQASKKNEDSTSKNKDDDSSNDEEEEEDDFDDEWFKDNSNDDSEETVIDSSKIYNYTKDLKKGKALIFVYLFVSFLRLFCNLVWELSNLYGYFCCYLSWHIYMHV